jgi:hypothetical protein
MVIGQKGLIVFPSLRQLEWASIYLINMEKKDQDTVDVRNDTDIADRGNGG